MHGDKLKHDLSANWGPFKMKNFREGRAFLFPHVGTTGQDSLDYWVVVPFENYVFIHLLFFVFMIFCGDLVVLLFSFFLSLVELCKFLLILFSGVWNFTSVAEVFWVLLFFRVFFF